ncbi:MAG: carboxypeptidase regulatory-like domain-containing protein [Mucilaginibacter sp.]
MSRTFLFFFLLLPCTVIAQFTISGKVLNHDDASPVANVSVFLNNATIGDKTTVDGIFTLRNVTPGKYDLIVSIVGFSTYSQPITVSNANIILPVINLHPKVIALHEVKIKFKEDPERQRNIDLFKNEFLGTSELAKECKIMNPELLDLNFDQQAQTLTAKSSDFLIIENNALGYRVKYLLSDFMLNSYDPNAKQFLYEGVVLFEELKGTPVQKAQWEKRRQEIYANSTVHFLRAALNNKLGEEGFIVLRYLKNPERPADSLINSMIKTFSALKSERQYRDSLSFWIKKSKLPKLLPKQQPVALTGEDIIEKKNKAGLYAFGCSNDVLYVVYNNLHQFNATSLNHLSDENNTSSTLVFFNVPFAYFDNNGAIFNTGSLAYTGAWANKRLAELLPLNYEPAQTEPPVDNTLLKKIDSNLKAFNVGHRIEKAYLHFDKPYYAAGDTIYFKAYVTNPAYDPSTLSSILNVELIGPADEICGAIKLKLTDGMAPGDFALADTLKSGNYRLRAYTGTMRNQSEDYFFDQNVFVVNVPPTVSSAHKSISVTRSKNQTVKSQQLNTVLNKIDVQFFPEGGNFVNGVVSKVAFKAIAPNGFGANVKGTITDEQGHFVTDFISQHLGMGLITITPQPGKAYRANLAYKDSTKAKFDLPKASDAGYALHIDNADPRNVRVNIIAGLQSHRAKIYLIAQSGGIIYVYMPVKLINNTFNALIPKSELPDGIVQFALFSANGEPMNERLVFSRNYDPLNLKLATENSISRPHQKVKISLAATDKDYTAVSGNFSVAVTDETRLPVDEDNESTILSYLLLASDIKGYVEKPNYYFTGKSDKAAADLDVLMLTQGYHRFEWKKMMNNEYQPVAFDPEKLTEVSGKITNAAGKPIPHCKISLLSVSNVFFALDTISDASGKFVFKHLLARDSMRYIIQAADKQARKNTLIEIDKVKLPTISENAMETDLKQDSSMITYLNFSRNFHQEQQRNHHHL